MSKTLRCILITFSHGLYWPVLILNFGQKWMFLWLSKRLLEIYFQQRFLRGLGTKKFVLTLSLAIILKGMSIDWPNIGTIYTKGKMF